MKEKEFVKVERSEDGITLITTNILPNEILSRLFPYGETSQKTIDDKEWIDLGLPSGTLWCTENEEEYYTYNESVKKFGNNLPTKEQMKELINICMWVWDDTNKGYTVTGSNGNSIFLPAVGYRVGNGNVGCKGIDGYYWSSTPLGPKKACYLYFYYGDIAVHWDSTNFRQSVRLIKNK